MSIAEAAVQVSPDLDRCIPPRGRWATLTPRLTDGELSLARKLDDELPDGWTIVVQARIGTANPDIVCFHPDEGFIVFEVKDWTPGSREFWLDDDLLMSRDTANGRSYVVDEPVGQVVEYRQVISELFTNLGDTEFMITSFAVLTHYPEDHRVFRLLDRMVPSALKTKSTRPHMLVVGRESLARPVSEWIPMIGGRSRSEVDAYHRYKPLPLRTCEHAKWLLRVPEIALEREEPLQIDAYKRDFVANAKSLKRRRVSGPAGSGKTTLLAACAAKAVAEGKRVLVLSFTITLRHWIHQQIKRGAPDGVSFTDFSLMVKKQVDIDYLHYWAGRMCSDVGYSRRARGLFRPGSPYPDEQYRTLTREVMTLRQATGRPMYDLILVDEFQNINAEWLPVIEMGLVDGGEVVVFRDATQNIYGVDQAKAETSMTGYRGPWNRLKESYRFPAPVAAMLSDFYDSYRMETDLTERPQRDEQTLQDVVDFEWVRCDYTVMSRIGAEMLLRGREQGFAPADSVFLVRMHGDGLAALEYLQPGALHEPPGFVHVFHKDVKHQRHLKKAFWPLRGEVKMCTIYSYQGWEAKYVVLCISPFGRQGSADDEDFVDKATYVRLIYTGLSRVARSLSRSKIVVVNAERRLDPFFERNFTEIEVPPLRAHESVQRL